MDENKQLVVSERKEEMMPVFAVSMEEAQQRLTELQAFIKSQMVVDEDYGIIPGCSKPSLYKPGAEKLAIIYGFSPRAKIESRVEDWEKGFFHYQVKCELVSKRTGFIVAEGLGACNSKEKRYRQQDAYTLNNTILKMAKKRALVDAVLTATRTSGEFTQDVEDIDVGAVASNGTRTPDATTPYRAGYKPSSDKQQKAIYAISKSIGMSDEDLKTMLMEDCSVEHTRDLSSAEASKMIDKLQLAK